MVNTIITCACSLVGSLLAVLSGYKLLIYRVELLEKKMDKHNSVIERTYKIEESIAVLENKESVNNHRLTDLEQKVG